MSFIHRLGVVLLALTLNRTVQLAIAGDKDLAAEKLADDGAWVRYHIKLSDYNGIEVAKKVTVSSVGRKIKNGRPSRWIEIREEIINDPLSTGNYVVKLLIPEKELLTAEKPLLHVARFVYKSSDGRIIDEIPDQDQKDRLNINEGPYLVFFPGCMQQSKKLEEPKTIDFQTGRLACDVGVTGRHSSGYRSTTVEADVIWTTDYSLWLHNDVPLGFAAATMKTTKGVRDDKGVFLFGPQTKTAEYFLEDMGTDAKSAVQSND